MATSLDNVVTLNITKATTAITTAEFNIPLLLGKTSTDGKGSGSKTALDVTLITKPSELATALGSGYETNELYKMANIIFAQNPRLTKLYAATVTGTTAATELAAVMDACPKWYGLCLTSGLIGVSGYLDGVKTWVSENCRILGVLATAAPGTTVTAYTNPVAGFARGFAIYHGVQGEQLHAGVLGKLFPYQPGSVNWGYKTIEGAKADALTPTQVANLETAKVAYYVGIAGVDVTQNMKMADGEWIDIVVGTDWISARIREEVFAALVKNPKLAYSDAGIQAVKALIEAVLYKAASIGILQKEGISVTVPLYADLSDTDKSNRHVSGIKFSAKYEGAINTVGIDGSLSY